MTLRVVSDNTTPPSGPEDDAVTYHTYDITYSNKATGLAETVRGTGYPFMLSGLFSLVKLDDKKNTYTEVSVPVTELILVRLVKDATEEA